MMRKQDRNPSLILVIRLLWLNNSQESIALFLTLFLNPDKLPLLSLIRLAEE
jgi:hypothetical protein